MFLTFTEEIFGDLNRDLKCAFECIQICLFYIYSSCAPKIMKFCGKLVLSYMNSGKNLRTSAWLDLQLQIFLLWLVNPCMNFYKLFMSPKFMKFVGGNPSTIWMLRKQEICCLTLFNRIFHLCYFKPCFLIIFVQNVLLSKMT